MNKKSSRTTKARSDNEMHQPAKLFKLSACAIVGCIGGGLIGTIVSWKFAPLAIWDVGALTFLIWTWLAIHGCDAKRTAALASVENPGHAITDITLILASVVSLAGVGVLLFESAGATETVRILHASAGILSIMISWAVVHTIYILRYAREYYKNDSGLDFHDKLQPAYSDFAYLGFTIGMTFQVSDTDLITSNFRKIALRHALLSYLFGTVIVATTINLIAGLGR